MQDKFLAEKLIRQNEVYDFEFPVYSKQVKTKVNNFHLLASKYYAAYLLALKKFLSKTGIGSLSKNVGVAQTLVSELDNNNLMKTFDKLYKMIELIKTQISNRELCGKTKLYRCYLTHIFNDLCKIYIIYFEGIKTAKLRFKNMDSKRKAKTVEFYDYFVVLSKEMKVYCEDMTVSLGIEYHAPFIYEAGPKTRVRMMNIIEKKPYLSAKSISENILTQRIGNDESSKTVGAKGNNSNKAEKEFFEFFNDIEPRNALKKIKIDRNRIHPAKDSSKRTEVRNEKTQIKKYRAISPAYFEDNTARKDSSQVNLLDSDLCRRYDTNNFEFGSDINLIL